jgi:hypothetical protein
VVEKRREDAMDVFYCGVCGYGYADQATAEECEAFCRANNACSFPITRRTIRKPRP